MVEKGFPKRRRYAQGRSALLWAAFAVFQREGFSSATVEMVCREAGYSKGGFYFHFPNKEALVRAVLAELDGWRTPGPWEALVPRLWAEARREPLRTFLAQRHLQRLAELRDEIQAEGRHHDAEALARLALALETGLQIQWQIMTSPAGRRQIRKALKGIMPDKVAGAAA